VGRLRSRSRSPERALIPSRNHHHDYDYDRRHGEDSTLHQTYSYPATDEGYDRTESRHFLSRSFPNAEEPRATFHHSLGATDCRVTSWKWSSRDDYYDIPDQYMGEGYRDRADLRLGSEFCRDYSCTSQLDPYEL
jgi:hypothetical protein